MSFGDDTEPRDDPLEAFDAFVAKVRGRLAAGAVQYGNHSFSRPPTELVRELQAEALDLAGWGFILWARLAALETAARAVEAS